MPSIFWSLKVALIPSSGIKRSIDSVLLTDLGPLEGAGGRRRLEGVTRSHQETLTCLNLANSQGHLCTTRSLFFQSAVQTLY